MKVSKIILASLLGSVVLSAAGADEYDGPRNRCKSKSGMIWVEATKTCVPKNACTADQTKYGSYCIRVFSDVQTPSVEVARRLANEYLRLSTRMTEGHFDLCDSFVLTGKEESLMGQNYIACNGADFNGGNYYVFEFDDTTNTETGHDGIRERIKAGGVLCEALGGRYDYLPGEGHKCVDITEDKCHSLGNAFYVVYQPVIEENIVEKYEENSCYFIY